MTEPTNPQRFPTLTIALAAAAMLSVLIWVAVTVSRPAGEPGPSPSASKSQAASATTDQDPSTVTIPTPSPTSSVIPLPSEVSVRATVAAAADAQFTGTDPEDQRARAYTTAGFAPELVARFTPVWSSVFDAPGVSKATIKATGEKLLDAKVGVLGTSAVHAVSASGVPGQRTFQVSVTVSCQPQWTSSGGGQSIPSPFTADWMVTVDEASLAITDVQQPTAETLPIHPGF